MVPFYVTFIWWVLTQNATGYTLFAFFTAMLTNRNFGLATLVFLLAAFLVIFGLESIVSGILGRWV